MDWVCEDKHTNPANAAYCSVCGKARPTRTVEERLDALEAMFEGISSHPQPISPSAPSGDETLEKIKKFLKKNW